MLVTEANFAQIAEGLSKARSLVVDTETTGLNTRKDRICGIGIKARKLRGAIPYYFAFRHYGDNKKGNLPVDKMHHLTEIIDKAEMVYGHNIAQFDDAMLKNEGAKRDYKKIRDTIIGAFICDEHHRSLTLENLAENWCGVKDAWRESEGLDKTLIENLLSKGDLFRLPAAKTELYACRDLDNTDILVDKVEADARRQNLLEIWDECTEYGGVLRRISNRGLLLDLPKIREHRDECRREKMNVYLEMRKIAGFPVRPTDKSFARWLGVDSADREYLEELGDSDPRAVVIRKFRDWGKVDNNYYKVFQLRNEDSILYPNLSQIIVKTGRLSCSKPNLQALPQAKKSPKIYKARQTIVARPGYEILEADYMTAEMRLACYYGGIKGMADVLAAGKDMHQAVADELNVTREEAKRVNFSIIYGIGAETLSIRLRCQFARAAMILKKYHGQYPGFKRLYYRADKAAKNRGYITMWTGRRAHYPDPFGTTPSHKASDHLIQGGVGELLRRRQTILDRELTARYDVHQLLQIHDSAVMEIPLGSRERVVPMVREIMEEHTLFYPPMVVDISCGPSMGVQHEVR